MRSLLAGGIAVAMLSACSSSDGSVPEVDLRACELYAAGGGEPVTAGTSGGYAPPISVDALYQVTLSEESPDSFRGALQVPIVTAGTYVFYYDAYLPVVYSDADTTELEPLSLEASVEPCSDVQMRQDLDLGAGEVYLDIGPHSEAEVGVVVVAVEDS